MDVYAGERPGAWKVVRARVTRRRRIRQFLTAVVPEWIELVPVVGGVTTALIRSVQTLRRGSAPEPGTAAAARRRSGAVAALDDALAAISAPLIVVLRRLERATDDDLAGAFHAIRTLPAHPVLLIATATTTHGRPPEPVLDLVREAERYGSTDVLRLAPLTRSEWTAAVESATGAPLPGPWRDWLAEREPLLPGELWRLLGHAEHVLGALRRTTAGWSWTGAPGDEASDDATRSSGPAVPPASVPSASLEGLESEDRRLLAAATEAGATFDTGRVQALTGLDELELQDHLARLERGGWIRFLETRPEAETFVDLYTVERPGLVQALHAWRQEEGDPVP